MKTLYKVFASILVAWFLAASANAITVVYTIPAGSAWNSTNLIPAAATLNSIKIDLTVGTATATNLTYALTDFPGFDASKNWGSIYRTNTGYMQLSQYLTNITKTVTNFEGLGQTTFPAGSTITNIITVSNVLFSYTNFVGPTSNLWRRVAVGTVVSNGTVTLPGPFPVSFGLGFTNNNVGNPIAITIDYDSSL